MSLVKCDDTSTDEAWNQNVQALTAATGQRANRGIAFGDELCEVEATSDSVRATARGPNARVAVISENKKPKKKLCNIM